MVQSKHWQIAQRDRVPTGNQIAARTNQPTSGLQSNDTNRQPWFVP
jgi:hypothetical protein